MNDSMSSNDEGNKPIENKTENRKNTWSHFRLIYFLLLRHNKQPNNSVIIQKGMSMEPDDSLLRDPVKQKNPSTEVIRSRSFV